MTENKGNTYMDVLRPLLMQYPMITVSRADSDRLAYVYDATVWELGVGEHSTLYLQTNCRTHIAFESDDEWIEKFKHLSPRKLDLQAVDAFDYIGKHMADIVHINVALVDNGFLDDKTYRGRIAKAMFNIADYVVCHDTEESVNKFYDYDFSSCGEVRHFERDGVRTTLLSKTKDISKFSIKDKL